jgi:hypothetical protein
MCCKKVGLYFSKGATLPKMYRLKRLQYPLVSILKGIRCLPELDQGVATSVVEPELEPKLESVY